MKIVKFGDIVEANGKTIRENNMELKHNIPLGSLVDVEYEDYYGNDAFAKIKARLYVVYCGRDCDGTPLYWLATAPKNKWELEFNESFQRLYYRQVGGFTEDKLTVIKEGK